MATKHDQAAFEAAIAALGQAVRMLPPDRQAAFWGAFDEALAAEQSPSLDAPQGTPGPRTRPRRHITGPSFDEDEGER